MGFSNEAATSNSFTAAPQIVYLLLALALILSPTKQASIQFDPMLEY